MSNPPWMHPERPFVMVRENANTASNTFSIVVIPRRKLPSAFPGNENAREQPGVVCTGLTFHWARFLSILLNSEYADILEELNEENTQEAK